MKDNHSSKVSVEYPSILALTVFRFPWTRQSWEKAIHSERGSEETGYILTRGSNTIPGRVFQKFQCVCTTIDVSHVLEYGTGTIPRLGDCEVFNAVWEGIGGADGELSFSSQQGFRLCPTRILNLFEWNWNGLTRLGHGKNPDCGMSAEMNVRCIEW